MGKRQSNLVLVEMMVQPCWSRGTALSGRKDMLRLSGLQGEGYRRIESAYAHTLTTATSTREGLLAAHNGFGWHEAYMPTDWRSRRSSLSQRKSGTHTSAFYAGVAKGGRFYGFPRIIGD